MKKTTINYILTAVIALMLLSIGVLIVCIATRPRYINTTQQDTAAVITEVPASDDGSAAYANGGALSGAASPQDSADTQAIRHGKTSTRVNVRNAPTEDAKVLETMDEGSVFEIVEVQDNGWTKILYNDQEAYISSAYVIIIND